MNVDSLRAHLADLPEPALPPALLPRIELARVRQRTRRRQLLATSVMVMVVAVAVIAPPFIHDRNVPTPEIVAGAPRAPLREEPLRTLDRELQYAYDRGASEQELLRLWQQREALARTGADTDIPLPVDI